MPHHSSVEQKRSAQHALRQNLPRPLFASLPLMPLRPLLQRIVTHVAQSHPKLFARLGPHAGKCFLIDPEDLPFVFVLRPDPARPDLAVHHRSASPDHDARIAGSFLDLCDMIDGSLDGDALFFSRDLRVSGDTEAVVALRNALDDIDGSIVELMAGAFGPLSQPVMLALSVLRTIGRRHENGRG
jgi:predicted lipid carrier protein YhbT